MSLASYQLLYPAITARTNSTANHEIAARIKAVAQASIWAVDMGAFYEN